MLADSIIEPDTLAVSDGRISISVRMPWYRALPLSSITNVTFTVDGVPIDPESLTWAVGGATYRLDELPPRHDKWWYVLDSAAIEGAAPEISRDEDHEVHVFIGLYIPYLPKLDGVRVIGDQDRKTMRVKEAA